MWKISIQWSDGKDEKGYHRWEDVYEQFREELDVQGIILFINQPKLQVIEFPKGE